MSLYTPAKPPTPQQPRDRTKLWAAVIFLLLTVACLAAVVVAVSGGRLPDLGQADVSWTPAAGPLNAPAAVPAPAGDDTRFAVGSAVQNINAGPVNLRLSPGFQNKPASDVIMAVPAGAVGTVVDGPQEVDGLTWWRVRFGEREGWMAERSSRGVVLLDRAPQ